MYHLLFAATEKKAIEESKELPLPFICVNFFLIRVMKIDLIFVSELRMKISRSHYSRTVLEQRPAPHIFHC